jgi:sugar phosphate isomerase/epimerase
MIKVGLYSITYSGTWYKGSALTPEEVVDKAAALGFKGVELDLKRPHGFPLDWSPRRREEFRNYAARKNIELPAMAANNNFASPVPELRENELLMVHEQLKLTRDLGAKVLRIFAAWNGITRRDGVATYEVVKRHITDRDMESLKIERWNWVRECIKECAAWAEEFGVVLALQDHAPLIEDYESMLSMVGEVGSPWVKCCLDAPCEPCQDEDYLVEAVKATGNLQVLTHYNGEWVRDRNERPVLRRFPFLGVKTANYPVFIRELKKTGYEGFMNFEFCHPALKGHVIQDIDYVHEQTGMALEYMKELIEKA